MAPVPGLGRPIRPASATPILKSDSDAGFDEWRPATAGAALGNLLGTPSPGPAGDNIGRLSQIGKTTPGLLPAPSKDHLQVETAPQRRLTIGTVDDLTRKTETCTTSGQFLQQSPRTVKIEERINLEHLFKLKQSFQMRSVTADAITERVVSFLEESNLEVQKLAGFGSDGASVMVGRVNGVATQLKRLSPMIVSCHCVAHRLALAMSDTGKRIPYVKKFNDLLQMLYQYYDASPIRSGGLRTIQAADKDGMATLNLDEFKKVLQDSLELRTKNDEEITELFMKIDSGSLGVIGWDQFCTYMQLEYEEKEEAYLRMKQVHLHTPAVTVSSPHKGENIFKVTNMSDGTCVTASQDGTVAFWSGNMELKRHRSLMNEQNASRQKPKWVTDLVLMPHYTKIILGTGDREIQFYELSTFEPYCQITNLETTPLNLDYCSTGHDECLLVYGDSEGCVNIIIIKGAGETLRTWKKMPKTEGIASVTLDKVAHSPLTQFLRWKVHNDWVAQLKYYDQIRSVISCSNHENTALVIGCTVGSTHVESQLKDIKEMSFQPDIAERKMKFSQQNYAMAKRRLNADQTVFQIHKGVKVFDYSKIKNMIVTGGMDRIIRIWNPYVPSKPTGMLHGHNAPIYSLFIAVDENRIYSLSQDKIIKVWDIRDQVCLLTVRPKTHKIRGDIHASLYNNISKVFVIVTDVISIITHKAKSNGLGEVVLTHKESVRAALYNPAFKHIVTASDGSVVKLWDYETGSVVFEFTKAHNESAITTMTFDSTGRRLITGGRDGKLKVWNYNNGHCLKNLEKEEGCEEVTAVTYIEMNKNRYIISVGWDRCINIFPDSVEDFFHVQYPMPRWRDDITKGHKEDILCIASCPPTLLGTASYDGEIIVWNLTSGHIYCCLRAPEFTVDESGSLDEDCSVGRLTFIPSRRTIKNSAQLIASGPRGCLHFWKVFDGGELYARFSCQCNQSQTHVSSLVISKDSSTLFVGDGLGFVSVWSIESYCLNGPTEDQPPMVGSWRAHTSTVTSMNLVEGQSVLITSSDDCTVRLWTTQGHYIGTLGQQKPWDIYDPGTYSHPMVPYDVLVDPMSLPTHPVLDGRMSVHDVIHAESIQDESDDENGAKDHANIANNAGPGGDFTYNDDMIAKDIKARPYRTGTGKRLRHEQLRKPPKDRGGPNTFQGLKCFDLDDEPPTMNPPPQRNRLIDDPFDLPF